MTAAVEIQKAIEGYQGPNDPLRAAHAVGDFHSYLGYEVRRLDYLLSTMRAVRQTDKEYEQSVARLEMMRVAYVALWQLKEACGYPIPDEVREKLAQQLSGGHNPYRCAVCESRRRFPEVHIDADAKKLGGMFVKKQESSVPALETPKKPLERKLP